MAKLLGRKVLAAFFTSLLAIASLFLYERMAWGHPLAEGEGFGLILGLTIYVVPIIFIYGTLCSVLAEVMSQRREKLQWLHSLLYHVLFGMAFIVPYALFFESNPFPTFSLLAVLMHPVTLLGGLFALLFLLIDRLIGYVEHKQRVEKTV